MAVVSTRHITFEEFISSYREDDRVEWVKGQVEFMSPASIHHERLVTFLAGLLGDYIRIQSLGEAFAGNYLMRLPSVPAGRVPDIMFVSNERLNRLGNTYLVGAADLVIEVVSPESDIRDRVDKRAEYASGGVREYWILDPAQKSAEFLVLDTEGSFQSVVPDENGRYYSSVVTGLFIDLKWLWEEPRPNILDLLREWGLL
jgi:Uma2 family endonuclease